MTYKSRLILNVYNFVTFRLTCHRIFEDPAGWMLGDSPPHSLTSNLSYKTDLFSYFKKFNAIQKIASNYAVIVDSLSLLLLYNSIGRVCRMLQNLQKYSLYSGIVEAHSDSLKHFKKKQYFILIFVSFRWTSQSSNLPFTRRCAWRNCGQIYRTPGYHNITHTTCENWCI